MENNGVDVIVNEEILLSAPSCVHGPTLLFERPTKSGRRRFYACSACRDRKSCSFFQWADEYNSAEKSGRKRMPQTAGKLIDSVTLEKRWKTLTNLSESSTVMYCHSCSQLLVDCDQMSLHEKHEIRRNITKQELKFPTYIIQPVENNKKEAQFYFTSQTTEFLISTLKKLEFNSVMCLGCPRVSERICQEINIKTILLDIDQRLLQFYSPNQLILYNMFNHHFFSGSTSKIVYDNFLRSSGKLCIVMDPPFGGMVEPLAFTLSRIIKDWHSLNKEINDDRSPAVFWMFPYFMEKRIMESCPNYNMLDYLVDYDNHRCFKSRGLDDKQRVSPIRIFTNLSAEFITLPESEGYRYCEDCKRYVSKMNRHCSICKNCPSKNGRPYFHCDMCQICTKSSNKHCIECGSCFPHDHVCGQTSKFKLGCHNCGDLGHKKNKCRAKKMKRFKSSR